jgi:hypothetical protein
MNSEIPKDESTPKSQNSLIFNFLPLSPKGEPVENQRILPSPLQGI